MVHPERLLLLALVLSVASSRWSPVAAFDDFLDDFFSIFFDSDSESDSAEPIQVNGKNATINVACDNCTLTINCPNCSSMMAGGTMMTVTPAPASPAPNGADTSVPQVTVAPTASPGSPAANNTDTATTATIAAAAAADSTAAAVTAPGNGDVTPPDLNVPMTEAPVVPGGIF